MNYETAKSLIQMPLEAVILMRLFYIQMPPEVLLAQKSKTAQGFGRGEDEMLQRPASPLTKTIMTQVCITEA